MYLDCLILQWFLDKLRSCFVVALILPATNVEVVLIITFSFTFLGLILLTEVSAARFVTRESVEGYELTHQNEVAQMDSLVELGGDTIFLARDEAVAVERLLHFLD